MENSYLKRFKKLTKEEITEIIIEKNNYKNSKAASIGALKIIQKYRGWISDNIINDLAKIIGITPTELDSIATFYNLIYRQPVGTNIILLCDSITCYINGYEFIYKQLKFLLGISIGETTKDKRYTLLPICCLGNCDKAPNMMINNELYSKLIKKNISNILEIYKNDCK
ncbi:NADH-quinone oxidoreductase subunit NuoE [Candidatus Portiera aleyrodidarum]|uniref:NADH-quinone oxidoreductase subunit E n=2 Tax=Candidatus Portiera aleyrodidarum TaxID=91844 RepID=A0AAU8S7D6_9GAMM|nr:NADH-quinone oxidoreductase subunit NuoE [Candidatus Portiera aleyrodidarum]AFQ23986.1 NADH dehydrogenase subunit E [Candidatus Portiera aleyrodidarum BT-B-HRs]AFS18751.1 NADH-ubiquinone oxidoreductase chain E [Candidatus Portiera aleyrodidarum BT-QVLC]AJF23965.1 NADH dehydrogenase [Candidatus Portiera aleyrodidarum MED (Bemisia tabaci)]ASX27203.1 NADH-quinone oxidoreductase subunit E [Candidatus Portiera aleyrodidarum MED (Bemisia tabaci)]AUI73171.1 NADH-quinone oxidoreductase subunit E [C